MNIEIIRNTLYKVKDIRVKQRNVNNVFKINKRQDERNKTGLRKVSGRRPRHR